jgi:hypothetical protein
LAFQQIKKPKNQKTKLLCFLGFLKKPKKHGFLKWMLPALVAA